MVDPIISGPENALLWTDYVLKNRGARQLRSPAVGTTFIRDYMLDFISFLLVISIAAVYLVLALLRLVVRRLLSFSFRKREGGSTGKFKAL